MISEIPKTPQQQGFSGFFFCSDNDLIQNKERTALNPSVAAEGEQPLTNHNASIADGAGDVNPQKDNSGKSDKNRRYHSPIQQDRAMKSQIDGDKDIQGTALAGFYESENPASHSRLSGCK